MREGLRSPFAEIEFKDLESRGFVLVRGFLSEAEVQVCREDFASQSVNTENRNYNLSSASGGAHDAVRSRVEEVLAQVRARTDLVVDLPLHASYFATARGVKFLWHQDHESFFAIQNHYDYLNFYIPIVKPRKDLSNLSIIPFDALAREDPRTFARVVRGGATRFRRMGERTMVLLDEPGTTLWMDGDLDRIAHTPELEPGDLLLIRGDVIHQTQDTETDRVSLSFRATRAETPVHRQRLADGGLPKAWMMMNDDRTYARMFAAFDALGREVASYAELQAAIDALPPSEAMGRKRFFRYLLRRKWRDGVFTSIFRNTAGSWLTMLRAKLRSPRPRAVPAEPRPPSA